MNDEWYSDEKTLDMVKMDMEENVAIYKSKYITISSNCMALRLKTTEANLNLQSWNFLINLLRQHTTRAQLGLKHFTKQRNFARDLSDLESGHDVFFMLTT